MLRDAKRVLPSSSWPELPSDLLRLIYRKLYDTFDFINFRAVCKGWLAAAPLSEHPPQFPFLIERETSSNSTFKLYSLHTSKTRRIHVPEARNRALFGQSQGYLITYKIGDHDTSVALLNPFTRVEVPLPFHGEGAGAFLGIQRRFHSCTDYEYMSLKKCWFEVYRLDEEQKPPSWLVILMELVGIASTLPVGMSRALMKLDR
ncbi:F-box protein SKIP23-like protein [Carex littledalei]|uniref:F-box protein SKIP23-like protein n=1 Tax=Carex littledalei TaxID=544730 RepID=A0A833QHM0_9POAL|nr:F-box protein SKIP23-like protein [Carex littledalei]